MSANCSGAAVIFLHGSGDSGSGIRSWLASMKSAFPGELEKAGVRFVYPDAPAIPYTLIGGRMQTVWFDRQAMSYEAPEDTVGMQRSVAQIDAEIDKLVKDGIAVEKIAIAGFSMGGCVALHVGLGSGKHAGKVGAVAALSTFLAKDSGLDAKVLSRKPLGASSRHGPPIFLAHGSSDPMISPQWAMATHARLDAAALQVPDKIALFQGMGHEMCKKELDQLGDFLLQNLGQPPSTADGYCC